MADSRQRRLSSVLVIAETAMAMVLLIGAGLLLKSFAHLLDVKPGFTTENLLTMQIGLPNVAYQEPQKRIAFMQQLEASLKGAPEVTSVGLVTRLPLRPRLCQIGDRPLPARRAGGFTSGPVDAASTVMRQSGNSSPPSSFASAAVWSRPASRRHTIPTMPTCCATSPSSPA